MRFTTDVEQFSEGSGLRKIWAFLWNTVELQERPFCMLWYVGLIGRWLVLYYICSLYFEFRLSYRIWN